MSGFADRLRRWKPTTDWPALHMQAAILLRPVPSQDEIEATRTKALAAIETARLTIKKGGHEQILQDLQLVINHTEFLACMMQDRDYASQEKRRFR